MPNKYPFQPLTKAHRTADHYLDTWIETMKRRSPSLQSQQVYGRIVATGVNFIVTGYNQDGVWTRVPCHNLATARLYLGKVMSELDFNLARIDNK